MEGRGCFGVCPSVLFVWCGDCAIALCYSCAQTRNSCVSSHFRWQVEKQRGQIGAYLERVAHKATGSAELQEEVCGQLHMNCICVCVCHARAHWNCVLPCLSCACPIPQKPRARAHTHTITHMRAQPHVHTQTHAHTTCEAAVKPAGGAARLQHLVHIPMCSCTPQHDVSLPGR